MSSILRRASVDPVFRKKALRLLKAAILSQSQKAQAIESMNDFKRVFMSRLDLQGRSVAVSGSPMGGASLTIRFVNLPGVTNFGDADAENNKMTFMVDGFETEPQKLKVELLASALPREFKLRAKSGNPAAIAQYLATFINGVVARLPEGDRLSGRRARVQVASVRDVIDTETVLRKWMLHLGKPERELIAIAELAEKGELGNASPKILRQMDEAISFLAKARGKLDMARALVR